MWTAMRKKIGEKAIKKQHNSCMVKCRRRKKKHQFFGCAAVGFEKRAAYNRVLMCAWCEKNRLPHRAACFFVPQIGDE